jgi:hypothetical protein
LVVVGVEETKDLVVLMVVVVELDLPVLLVLVVVVVIITLEVLILEKVEQHHNLHRHKLPEQ